jgi:DinB family protein
MVDALPLVWAAEARDQLTWYWDNLFRPRLEGLTDEEYLWEPVNGCWSVRQSSDGRWTWEHAWPPPDPEPFTTIAWRICHIGSGVLGFRASNHFGDGSQADESKIDWPSTATDALAFLDDAYHRWLSGLESMSDDDYARPCGPAEGPFAQHPFGALVLHISREVFHHGAEIATLRDLYRASNAGHTFRT